MKNIFCCLLILLCTPVIAGKSPTVIASDCIIEKSTSKERFGIFKLAVDEMININMETYRIGVDKIEIKSDELPNLLKKMMFRCEKELMQIPQKDARGLGAILMKEIMLEVINNPKVQKLYE